MRYAQATWRVGPVSKLGYTGATVRTGKGVVLHSAEGGLSTMMDILDSGARKSWCFSNPKSGPLLQHYEIEAVTWHAGYEANRLYVGVEHEGMAGELLTPTQIANDIELIRWLDRVEHWPGFERRLTLWEHNEFMATACPIGRIPWASIVERLTHKPVDELAIRVMCTNLAVLCLQGKLQECSDSLAYIGVRPSG